MAENQAGAQLGAVGNPRPLRPSVVADFERMALIPTAISNRTLPVSRLAGQRHELNRFLAESGNARKVSFNHIIMYAVARSLELMPQISVRFERTPDGNPVAVSCDFNVGILISTRGEDGTYWLGAPIIKDTDRLNFAAFYDEHERLVEGVRSKTLPKFDLTEAAITVTNIGIHGNAASGGMIMPGQGSCLSVGAVGYPAEYRHLDEAAIERLGIGMVMTLALTYDHRVIQGPLAAQFLGQIESLLEGEQSFYEGISASLR